MKKFLILALLVPALAFAEKVPPRGADDPRVRTIDYNPMDVVRLATFFGVSTHIKFAPDETIQDVAIGDDQAWKVVPRGNHLFIKPLATHADTNVTVVTDKRTYQFALVIEDRPLKDDQAWSDPNLIFSLTFRYPELAAQQRAAVTSRQLVQDRLAVAARAEAAALDNTNYWGQGSPAISPTGARDDGRFIYLTFNNNTDMPAVYTVDGEDNEALVNTNVVNGNTIVVQRLVARLMLRKGADVASVVNRSFKQYAGSDNTTGTVSGDVQRVVRGQEPPPPASPPPAPIPTAFNLGDAP